jgi:hypothetical protein
MLAASITREIVLMEPVLMMEAASISETSVNFTKLHGATSQRRNHLPNRHCENMKSHQAVII